MSRKVRIVSEFICMGDSNPIAIIQDTLEGNDTVSFISKVNLEDEWETPVTDADMGISCDGCRNETDDMCPCKKCTLKSRCCENIDAECRSVCDVYKDFANSKKEV
jgi:hypothetical protein